MCSKINTTAMPSPFKIKDKSAFPAPAAVYNWRIYGLAMSAAMGSAMFGYDSAFIGGAITLPAFKAEFGLDTGNATQAAALSANIVTPFKLVASLVLSLSHTLPRSSAASTP